MSEIEETEVLTAAAPSEKPCGGECDTCTCGADKATQEPEDIASLTAAAAILVDRATEEGIDPADLLTKLVAAAPAGTPLTQATYEELVQRISLIEQILEQTILSM